MRAILLASLLLASLAPAGVWAQGAPEQRIEAARQRAAQAGVPVALLDAKVAEGRAKGVSVERIAGAVEQRLELLGRARQAMGPRTAAADLSVGADALNAGVSAESLGALAAKAPAPERAVAIAVLTQLVRDGEASERALERVTAALNRGPDALRELPGQAAAARQNRPLTPPGRERGAAAAGRGQGGPPASVPAPGEGRGRGRGHEKGKP
jgi:hypothetical protein